MKDGDAFSYALALESASDSRYTDSEFRFTAQELYRYAKIVAYKVGHNIHLGRELDPFDDPLTYIDCGLERDMEGEEWKAT